MKQWQTFEGRIPKSFIGKEFRHPDLQGIVFEITDVAGDYILYKYAGLEGPERTIYRDTDQWYPAQGWEFSEELTGLAALAASCSGISFGGTSYGLGSGTEACTEHKAISFGSRRGFCKTCDASLEQDEWGFWKESK